MQVVLVVLVRVVQVWDPGESHLLTGCKEQGISGRHFQLGFAIAGGLLQACQEWRGAVVHLPEYLSAWFPVGLQGGQ